MKSTIVSLLALASLGGLTFAAVDQHAAKIQMDVRNTVNGVLQKHAVPGVRHVVEGRDVTVLGDDSPQWQEARKELQTLAMVRQLKDKTRGEISAQIEQMIQTELWLSEGEMTLIGQSPDGLDKEGFIANLADSAEGIKLVDKLREGGLKSEQWPYMVDAVLAQSGLFNEMRVTIKGEQLVLEGETKPEVDIPALANALRQSLPESVQPQLTINPAPGAATQTAALAQTSEAPSSKALSQTPRQVKPVAPLSEAQIAQRTQCQNELNELLAREPIRFQRMKAEVDDASLVILDQVVSAIGRCGEADILVEGHTDSRGDKNLNRTLSDGRAKAVRQYLIEQGVEAARLDARGFGSQHPIADNKTSAGRAKNRRIELVVSGAQE